MNSKWKWKLYQKAVKIGDYRGKRIDNKGDYTRQ